MLFSILDLNNMTLNCHALHDTMKVNIVYILKSLQEMAEVKPGILHFASGTLLQARKKIILKKERERERIIY